MWAAGAVRPELDAWQSFGLGGVRETKVAVGSFVVGGLGFQKDVSGVAAVSGSAQMGDGGVCGVALDGSNGQQGGSAESPEGNYLVGVGDLVLSFGESSIFWRERRQGEFWMGPPQGRRDADSSVSQCSMSDEL